jgi:hypothetical protein
MNDSLMILPPAAPPSGLWWRERFEGGAWRFRARPGFSGRQAGWLAAGLVIASFAIMCQAPLVILGGVALAVVAILRKPRPHELVIGPEGFSFVGRTTIERLADIDRFDTVVDAIDGGPVSLMLLRAVVHTGPPIAFLLDPLDRAMVAFVAARLNAALHQIRETRGYRG